MTAPIPDFAKERGLKYETLQLFNVRVNGTGWLWDTKCMTSGKATRWKSFYSVRENAPETEQENWQKYRWYPNRPADAQYFYPPEKSLKSGVDQGDGELWLVGGEVAAMSMFDAGFANTTSFFGDSNIPDTLATDLRNAGVVHLRMIPDRDESGQACAMNVRDALKDSGIKFTAYQLPYPLETKHGKDVNDYWLSLEMDAVTFLERVDTLPEWALPAPQPKPVYNYETSGYADTDLPTSFIADIERALDVYPVYNSDGWSRRNVSCPFHDDVHASATWNHNKAILRCHAGCGKSYLAKDVGGHFGIDLRHYGNIPYTNGSTAPQPEPTAEAMAEPQPKLEIVTLRPSLPADADLNSDQRALAKQGRKWLDECVQWAVSSCPLAPEIFHEAMALWLLATVSTRRMKLTIGGEDIYPNLYVMIVAKTTLYHKSTALNTFRKLIKATRLEPLLLPIDVTPEALFDELAGMKPMNFDNLPEIEKENWLLGRAVAAQRSIIKDEASSILANLKKDYNAGLSELLLQGYDGDAGTLRKLLKSKGLIVVRDMCISFLGATTPVMYSKYIGNEESENGFIARFAMITPEGVPVYRNPSDDIDIPVNIITAVRRMFMDVLPWYKGQKPSAPKMLGDVESPPVMSVQIDVEALQQLNRYRKALGYDMLVADKVDENKAANYARLGTMAFKIAMLLAAIDTTGGTIQIKAQHAYASQQICERWRESLHRLERDIARTGNTIEDKVLAYLKSAGTEGVTMRELIRDCGIKDGKVKALGILNTLADEAMVEIYDRKPDGAGRPTKKYRIPVVEPK